MRLNLIYARARNGVIGQGGGLPWHLPEDLAHFKRMTAGCPVIMGRKTWDSLPARFRPLPGRPNIVVTRQALWAADGAHRAGSLQEAVQHCMQGEPVPADAWVIGGAELYTLALPLAERAIVTELELEVHGDTFAPVLGDAWAEAAREPQVSQSGLHFAFVTYLKSSKPPGTVPQ